MKKNLFLFLSGLINSIIVANIPITAWMFAEEYLEEYSLLIGLIGILATFILNITFFMWCKSAPKRGVTGKIRWFFIGLITGAVLQYAFVNVLYLFQPPHGETLELGFVLITSMVNFVIVFFSYGIAMVLCAFTKIHTR